MARKAAKAKTRRVRRPVSRGRKLRCARGYTFKKVGRNRVALMRRGLKITTFTCECSTSGGCRVEMDGQTASCLERGCTGRCGWVVNVPGIVGGLSGMSLARR